MNEGYVFDKGEYYCDGGCLNSGGSNPKAYGSWRGPDGLIHTQVFATCGTNNQAEYQALITLLELMPQEIKATIYIDSDLVRKQLNGEYRVKTPSMKPFYNRARSLLNIHPHVTIERIGGDEMKRILGH